MMIATLLAALLLSNPGDDNHYRWGDTISLRGSLSKEVYFGPPNYGETPEIDKKEQVYFLWLEEKISISGPSNAIQSEALEQDKIQLLKIFKPAELPPCIIVTGDIFEAISGHHRAQIMMNVRDVKHC